MVHGTLRNSRTTIRIYSVSSGLLAGILLTDRFDITTYNRRISSCRNMFAKRHYEAIAETMQHCCPQAAVTDPAQMQWQHAVNALITTFANDNSRFSGGRFRNACEPGANVRART